MPSTDVYVITGGAGGMGLATARTLAPKGQVLLADLGDGQLEEARRTLHAQDVAVAVQRCDVASSSDTAALASRIASMGQFRGLVHTAGLSPLMSSGRRVLDVDLVGSARVLDAVSPLLRSGSSAVLIASIAAYGEVDPNVEPLLDNPLADDFLDRIQQALGRELDGGTAYMLAKRGVVRLAERLAAPWGSLGARITAICPGLIDTPMGRLELESQPMMPGMVDMTPIKRPGQPLPGRPEDIADAAAFLLSDAASFISGCDLRVDGGLIGATRTRSGAT